MSERELQACVEKLCKLLGIMYYHTHRSDRSVAGYPDYTLIGQRKLLMVELKSDKGKVSPAQTQWIEAFRRAGVDARVWRPAQWRDGLIEAQLKELACESPSRRVA